VIVEAIKPQSSGSGWSDPKTEASRSALVSNTLGLSDSSFSEEAYSESLAPFVRGVSWLLRNSSEKSESTWVKKRAPCRFSVLGLEEFSESLSGASEGQCFVYGFVGATSSTRSLSPSTGRASVARTRIGFLFATVVPTGLGVLEAFALVPVSLGFLQSEDSVEGLPSDAADGVAVDLDVMSASIWADFMLPATR